MNGQPLQHTVLITNPQGFHLRPKANFATLANRFQSSVTVSWEGQTVNGKSILELMLLAAQQGSQLVVEVDGPDAPAALNALVAVLSAPSAEPPPPGNVE
jgi:phosphotransferase system HPr (HPr) family protein